MADKTTGELQQELMEQPNIKAYLSKNRSCFMEEIGRASCRERV